MTLAAEAHRAGRRSRRSPRSWPMPPPPASRWWSAATAPSSACCVRCRRRAACPRRNLTGITLYAPKELVISARAGTPLSEIEARGRRRRPASDRRAARPDRAAGYGERCRAADPRRRRRRQPVRPAPRGLGGDARPRDGRARRQRRRRVIRSGGRVLKNVTGLDLCKLLAGSHGTLAVITEITLKVLPAPETTGSLLIPGLDAGARRRGAVGRARLALRRLGCRLAAGRGSSAGARPGVCSGRFRRLGHAGPDRGFRRLRRLPPRPAARRTRRRACCWTTPDSRDAWRAVRDAVPLPAAPDDAVWRVSVRPSAGPGVLAGLASAGVRGFLDWGGGLVWLAGASER